MKIFLRKDTAVTMTIFTKRFIRKSLSKLGWKARLQDIISQPFNPGFDCFFCNIS